MSSRVDSLGKYGLNKDAAAFDLAPGAFSDAGNMRFRDGYAERMRGQSQIFTTPSVTPYCLFSYRSGTSKYWVHLGTASAFVDDGTTRTDLTPGTPFTGAVDDRWTGGVASGVLVVNNGVDKPQYWGGNVANDFAALTAWDANWRCASLRPFKNYLVACDVTKSGTRYANMVKWSAAADPGALPASWDAADATKDAGEQDLAETTDQIIDQLRMGDINVIYKERSIYGMQYIGDPYIFRFYRLPGDMGLLARGCVVNTPVGHVVLSPGDVILHSGQGPRSIINGKRATASDGRATIGAPCDCAGAIVEGKTTYCKVPPSASVAVCSQVPPEAEPAPDPGLPPPKPPAASHAGLLGSAGGGVMPRTPIAPRPARV